MTIPEDMPQPTSFYDGVEGLEYPKEAEWFKDEYNLASATLHRSGRVSWSADR